MTLNLAFPPAQTSSSTDPSNPNQISIAFPSSPIETVPAVHVNWNSRRYKFTLLSPGKSLGFKNPQDAEKLILNLLEEAGKNQEFVKEPPKEFSISLTENKITFSPLSASSPNSSFKPFDLSDSAEPTTLPDSASSIETRPQGDSSQPKTAFKVVKFFQDFQPCISFIKEPASSNEQTSHLAQQPPTPQPNATAPSHSDKPNTILSNFVDAVQNCPLRNCPPCQIKHEGNSCFLAAAFQMFTNLIRSGAKAKSGTSLPPPLAKVLEGYTQHLKSGSMKPFEGIAQLGDLKANFHSGWRWWRSLQQSDALEVLEILLQHIQIKSEINESHEVTTPDKATIPTEAVKANTPILHIPFPKEQDPSIAKGLQQYAEHQEDGSQTYEMEGNHYPITKTLNKFTAPPKHLVVNLKRFTWNQNQASQKIQTPLTGDPLRLNLPQECLETPESSSPIYDLIGAIVHTGSSANSGHYVAYISQEGSWFCLDDMQPTARKVDPSEVQEAVNKGGYLMSYKRHTPT